MNGSAVGPSAAPWDSLGSVLGFPNEDQKFWWTHLAPNLGKFMIKANYTTAQQFAYLSWFHSFILPTFGPRPIDGQERLWKCGFTPTGAPFQPSWNIQGQKKTVRFTIEPLGKRAGTRADPFNQEAAVELMRRLKPTMPNMVDDWFWHCARGMYVPNDLINIMIMTKGPPKGPKPPTCLVAFDLNDGEIETKAYFFPHIKAFADGISRGRLIIDVVRGLNDDEVNMNPGLDLFEEYLNSGGAAAHKNVEMLAIDCIDKTKARAKIYVNSYNNSFNKVKDIYTMGGRLNDKATTDSLKQLAQLWCILFDMPTTGFEDTEIPNIQHHRACFVTGFEFKTGSAKPVTKIYFPMWHYAQNDSQISERLAKFFASQGWNDIAKSYANDVKEAFMEPELDTSLGTHQYLSFSPNAKKGLYTTIYYAPTIPHLTTRHTPVEAGDADPMMQVGPPGDSPPLPLRVLRAAWPALRWVVPRQVAPAF